MNSAQNLIGEDVINNRNWDILFYILGSITFCFLISTFTFYWHAGIIKDGLSYIYADKKKFPGLQLHETIVNLFCILWIFSFIMVLLLTPFALFRKRKVSWKALLFCIASQVMLFLYFKFSSFLDWYID